MKLNLGCGRDYLQGFVNLDYNNKYKTDVNWNLKSFPYPFKDNTFDEIYCSHILEHFGDEFFEVISELTRILKKKGIIHLRVPHFSNGLGYSELTHKRFFGWTSFEDFTSDNINYKFDLKIVSRRFNQFSYYYPLLNKFTTFQNLFPKRIYERLFCWILPVAEIEVKLEKIK